MLTDAELALGGYRFEDLQALRIIENRTDLARKQDELGFPKPVKTGKSQALFLKIEVHAWLRKRAALRDAPKEAIAPPAKQIPSPRQIEHKVLPPRKRGRPRKDQTTPPPVVPKQPKPKPKPSKRRAVAGA